METVWQLMRIINVLNVYRDIPWILLPLQIALLFNTAPITTGLLLTLAHSVPAGTFCMDTQRQLTLDHFAFLSPHSILIFRITINLAKI